MLYNKASDKKEYSTPAVVKFDFVQQDLLTSSTNDVLMVGDKENWVFKD